MAFDNTSNYDPVAAWYDDTRDMPPDLLMEAFRRIGELTGFGPEWRVLDAGCGTGQLTMPLIGAGYEVVGVDVSAEMLQRAEQKLQPDWRGTFLQGDVRSLEFDDGSFDAVAVSKLFQHVGEWTKAIDEIVRVARPGGIVMSINEKGAFRHTTRRRFAEACDRRGFDDRTRGNRNRAAIAAEFARYGANRIELDLADLAWSKDLTYRQCLEHMRLRLHSEFWAVPDPDYDEILDELSGQLGSEPEGLDTTETLTPYLRGDVFVMPL